MALLESVMVPLGTPAPSFELPGVDGKTYRLEDFEESELLVVIFTCNHCPYAKACEDRLVALQADYAPKGVRLVAINPNDATTFPEDSFDKMVERAGAKGFNFPYLRDESQEVAKRYKAVCTPDIFVYDGERKLRYRGRIDDNWKDPSAVTRHDLREALDLLLDGKPAPKEQRPSMGCSIKWL